MKLFSLLFLLVVSTGLSAQPAAQTISFSPKQITNEDIWQKGTFQGKGIPGFNFLKDGVHYTLDEKSQIVRYNIVDGKQDLVILDAAALKGQEGFPGNFDDYSFSADEQKILLKTGSEPIYRHSSVGSYFVYDAAKKTIQPVYKEKKQLLAQLTPNGDKIAFVCDDNNIYYKDLTTGQVKQVSTDGKKNNIINGSTDWVYEEEFSFTRAFEWSTDGMFLAYIKFDESKVPQFTIDYYNDDIYPDPYTYKYPKVGEDNAIVGVHIFNLNTGKTAEAAIDSYKDMYIPRIKWTKDPGKVCVFKMNRLQNDLQLLSVDAATGKSSLMFQEKNKAYIDINDDLTFLKDGKSFIWNSEMEGYSQLYQIGLDGKIIKKITPGNYDVTAFYGINEKNGKLYYQSAETSPMDRQVYSVNLDGTGKMQLTSGSGYHEASFSGSYAYFVDNVSTINSPTTYTVFNDKGKKIRVIEQNTRISDLQKEYQTLPAEFFTFKTSEGVDLNGWMIKPANVQPGAKTPVFMYLYGGPNSQQVTNSWKGANYWWFQMLAQKGYMIVCVDNRGTGARGEAFRKVTYLQLGKYETMDQIEAAKYIGSLPGVDKDRIGIFGWSYGGYMSSLCLLKGNDVFKAAIAVAPVTNWKWYDSIYTERYMRTTKDNEAGYKENSPVYFANRLKGHYLLIHGTADDNVHFQNSVEMSKQLIKSNKQFDTYYYPNRNHGIYGDNARIHLFNKMTDFVLKNI